jgi:glucose/arabinose dehydrogenase
MRAAVLGALTMILLACGPAPAREEVSSSHGPLSVDRLATGLEHPWGLAFLPDGRMLVTERPGRLRIVLADGTLSEPLSGVPEVFAEGQGGLLDVALDPDFENNGLVYLSFSEPGEGGAGSAVARGRLAETGLERTEVIFRQVSKVSGGNHFGSRLAFSPDGHLFVTLGERFKFEPAQDLSNHLGTVVRIRPDGSVPDDNPFVGRENARPEIWSYGHRNIEAAAIHPGSGALWIGEMGPKGGDELNVPEAGKNYGWPVVSWGEHYDGEDIPDPPTQPRFADAIHQWTPVISPSGMIFYDGSGFPDWRGDLLIGSLTRKALMRVSVEGGAVTGEEQIDMGARIRDVEQGPDGAVYLLTDQDDGAILRLAPDTAEEGG